MKTKNNSAHTVVALMIDLLLAVLLLLAFYIVKESTGQTSPAQGAASPSYRQGTSAGLTALNQPRLKFARGIDERPRPQANRPSGERKLNLAGLATVRER